MSPEAPSRALDLGLYLVTDDRLKPFEALLDLLPALVGAGVSLVQLRDKLSCTRELVVRTRALVQRLHPLGVPVIVNDRTDVAFAAGADGVHLGSDDLSVNDARALLGGRAIIGASVDAIDGAWSNDMATYFAASPVFETPTKRDTSRPLGLEGLRALRARTSAPIVGIGGIGPAEADAVTGAGADGVAVISAILAAPDPVAATRALREASDRGRRNR